MLKLIRIILGCVLVAVFSSGQAQAGVVIDNTLYIPLNIRLSIGCTNKNGTIDHARITSKDILKMLGYTNKVQLAINTGSVNNDVYVISKNSVVGDVAGILTVNANQLLDSSTEGKNGQFRYNSLGVLSLKFYSNPQFVFLGGPAFPPIINPIPDPDLSQAASDYWFEVGGIYSYNEKSSPVNGGKQNIAKSFKVEALSGAGYDVELDAPNPTTVTGRASASGGGQILIEAVN